MAKKIFFALFLLGLAGLGYGQQDPQYSQYMFNGLALNPAYAGSREMLSTTLLYRTQWLQMDGAPTTQTFSAHLPTTDLRHGFGLNLINDEIAVTRNMNAALSYAYRIPMNNDAVLSFGIQGVINQYSHNLDQVRLNNSNDNAFTGNTTSLLQPNAGAGVYWKAKKWYAGASVPYLIPSNLTGISAQKSMHVLGTAGCIIGLGSSVKFKPSTMVKYVPGAPVSVDLNGSFLFKEVVWVGASYRVQDALVFMVEFWPTPYLRIGYAYDKTLSELKAYNTGSHEVMLGFDLNFAKKNIVSPRYF